MGVDPLTMFLMSAGSQIVSGFAQYTEQKRADKAAASRARKEAALAEGDADRAAQEELTQSRKTEALQRMLYLKSGVDISGSPLLVMEETRNKGAENAKNVKESGYARADLIREEGSIKRANLVGVASDVAKGIAGSYSDYQTLEKLGKKQLK